MKTIRKSELWVSILSIVLAMVLICGINFTFINTAYAGEIEEKVANMTENNYAITNTKTPNNLRITLYAEKYYGKKAALSWGNKKTMQILGNDDIIKIVPEELFKKEGITQHIGKEYGFFIETKKHLQTMICCFQP